MDDDTYTPDTIVVDLDGWQHATTRVESVDVMAVQIHGDSGVWHKVAIGGGETACGEPISYRLGQLHRMESYAGNLCPVCFTPHELSKSATINAAAKKEEE